MAIRWRAYRGGYNYRPGSRSYYRPRYFRRGYGGRWRWAHAYPLPGPAPSSSVAWAQQVLTQIFGPVVPQDGILGPETRGFVARFQAHQGLAPTGDLDDMTMSALQAATTPPPREPPPPPPVLAEPPPPVVFAAARDLPEVVPGPPPHHDRPPPPEVIPGPPPPHHHRPPPPGEARELDENPAALRGSEAHGRWIRRGERVILFGI